MPLKALILLGFCCAERLGTPGTDTAQPIFPLAQLEETSQFHEYFYPGLLDPISFKISREIPKLKGLPGQRRSWGVYGPERI